MTLISYKRHRFSPDVTHHAIRLYGRFTLPFRDAGEPLAERGVDVCYETELIPERSSGTAGV